MARPILSFWRRSCAPSRRRYRCRCASISRARRCRRSASRPTTAPRGGPAADQFDHRTALGTNGSLQELRPFRVIVMASERMEDGIAKQQQDRRRNRLHRQARRVAPAKRLRHGARRYLSSISRSAPWSPTPTDCIGRPWTRSARCTPIRNSKASTSWAGFTNIGQQLPPKAADGSDLKFSLECAFPHSSGAARLRHRFCARRGETIIRCRKTITFLTLTRIFSSRPAATRYVRCASSTGLDATAEILNIHLAEYARLIVTPRFRKPF